MSETTTLHLPDKYREAVCSLLHQYLPQADVWAYGSRVHGDHYDASDLDLVARCPANQTSNLGDLREAFTESNLPIILQIVDWDRIPEDFRQEILVNYVVLQPGGRDGQ